MKGLFKHICQVILLSHTSMFITIRMVCLILLSHAMHMVMQHIFSCKTFPSLLWSGEKRQSFVPFEACIPKYVLHFSQ